MQERKSPSKIDPSKKSGTRSQAYKRERKKEDMRMPQTNLNANVTIFNASYNKTGAKIQWMEDFKCLEVM